MYIYVLYIFKMFLLYPLLYYFTFQWAEPGVIGPWLGWRTIVPLWNCWLGHVTRKTISEMTYSVSSGTLNSTIPRDP